MKTTYPTNPAPTFGAWKKETGASRFAYDEKGNLPHWDKEKEVLCTVCDGEEDTCENCNGNGTVLLTGADADEHEREMRESHNEDYKNDY